jgi:hypothetical protein
MSRPPDWLARVNTPMRSAEEEAVRNSIKRGTPLGSEGWARETAQRLDQGFTLRNRGRPRNGDGTTSKNSHSS